MSSLHKKILALFIISVVDSLFTVFMISKGWASEANPIMEWYMHQTNLSCMGITKIVVTFLLLSLMIKQEIAEKYISCGIGIYLFMLLGPITLQLVLS